MESRRAEKGDMGMTGFPTKRIDHGARRWLLGGWAAAVLLSAGCGGTASPPVARPVVPAAIESPPVSIASEAREVIDRMATFFGATKSFSLRQVSTTTVSDEAAKKFAGEMEHVVRVERPNRLAVVLTGDQPGSGTVISDGQSLVIHQKQKDADRYESSPAPATLSHVVDNPHLRTMLGVGGADVVTKALLAEDPAAALLEGVQELSVAGPEEIDGSVCTHLVARSESGNWDLWVATGDEPVPVKFVPTIGQLFVGGRNVDLSSTVIFDQWRFDPDFEPADFAFVPREGCEKVDSLSDFANQAQRERLAARPALHSTVGFPITPLSLVGVDGSRFDASMQHNKIVVLDFWASWCGPCRASLPVVAQVCKEYADKGIVFRAVNLKEDAETIRAFLQEEPIDAPVVMDPDGAAAMAYRVEAIPHTVIIGRDGIVEAVHVGASEGMEAKLRKQLDALLEGKSLAPKGGNSPRAEPI
jgi:peroxiredoxin